jgi:pyruvate-formate lyase-activating enzyme
MGAFFRENQDLGRRNAVGCVALEITQRCNLDCTLCYLSESSERVKDVPLAEVFRRIDAIADKFGCPTSVQITGGDPTLRAREELVAVVRRVRERGLLPTLMTNGIRATRDLLEELCAAGLNDVAFHVDLTQERRGYPTEEALNAVREEYIERARGLPIAVIFNTTVCRENFDEIPALVRFFRRHADAVGMASFQLQADTGRGVLRERDRAISLESVRRRIGEGAGIPISWDTILIGHPACHRIGITLESNGNLYDLNDDPVFFNRFLDEFRDVVLDRRSPGRPSRRSSSKRSAGRSGSPGPPPSSDRSSGRCAGTSSPRAAASTNSPSSYRTSWMPTPSTPSASTPALSWS